MNVVKLFLKKKASRKDISLLEEGYIEEGSWLRSERLNDGEVVIYIDMDKSTMLKDIITNKNIEVKNNDSIKI